MNNKDIKWRKIRRPLVWRPRDAGEELVGYYVGRTVRDGQDEPGFRQ